MEPERAIRDGGVIAIARGVPRGTLRAAAAVLLEAGVLALEVTLDSPEALDEIAWLRAHWDGRMAIGAGTVLTTGQVREAKAAGAQFVVSPNVDAAVIGATVEAGLVSVPGAMTATETLQARAAGATFVKLFPAGVLGPDYLRALRGPLSDMPFVPTGGVGPDNAEAFIRAGAVAVAVGGELFGKGAGPVSAVADRARALVQAVRRGRGAS
ncbi:MAG: bifunctional 4-hydroxy-2-oxoglutarate aldolase/2-dehydro-3-deoxy-phosphogluconate aldolase [Clostridia bacterium]|nr:bifunctional 4-hydroxy-2-oxoglutarate aldolase/2-dehydro-3-deoxy-phosphogluconate aldolase [Clostridia bacterium]